MVARERSDREGEARGDIRVRFASLRRSPRRPPRKVRLAALTPSSLGLANTERPRSPGSAATVRAEPEASPTPGSPRSAHALVPRAGEHRAAVVARERSDREGEARGDTHARFASLRSRPRPSGWRTHGRDREGEARGDTHARFASLRSRPRPSGWRTHGRDREGERPSGWRTRRPASLSGSGPSW
ncbi:hypothetical protein HMPREF0063_12481 [Aeromicrobium marinum DSM 15272]|uniref:Uncharacterized protein n=1 Tax=Aeromicrobium marinum DSM 15272 TaxID=585531 RepID=E2SEM2_9ACTN|nr:hypothetical protein HMPREF0063_12481 [Aeromicrobium marinum DSM 15272]